MKLISAPILTLFLTVVAMKQFAASLDWTGAGGAAGTWSASANWSPPGPPASGDDVRFFDVGAVLDTLTVNNTVSANTTVRSLWFGQTNGFHNLLIEPGIILTVQGTNDNGFGRLGSDPSATTANPNVQSTLYVGTKVDGEVATKVTATISGDGGTLVLNNTNNEVNIRQAVGGTLGGGDHRAILDMSGLGTLIANLSRIRVGDGEANPIRRAEGQLHLAKTNRITLSGPSVGEDVQLLIGNNDVNNNGNGSISYLYLGQDNVLHVDHVLVGARKQQGNISFRAGLTAPTLVTRGSDGTSRVAALRVGDESDQANSGNSTIGRIDLTGGSADIRVDRIIVGKGQQQTGAAATGFLTIGAGNLDANTIEIAYQTSETANNPVTGTATFNGTTVVVNDMLRLGRAAGSLQARNATLNLNGASLIVSNRMVTEGSTTAVNMTNSTLILSARSPLHAGTLILDGGMISNAAAIRITNAFTVANFATIAGNPIFDMGNSAATWDLQGIDSGVLTVSNTFQGSGTFIGDLIQAPGATISPGGSGAAGTLAIQGAALGGNMTLNAGTLRFDLSTNGLSGNDQITVSGTLSLNGTNDVNLTSVGGAFDSNNPYTLITAGTLNGNQNNLRVAGALAQSRYTFTFSTATPNSVQLSVGGTGPAGLTWVGNPAANTWDVKGAANWTRGGPSAEQFFSLDAVAFNDLGSALPAVTLAGALSPGSMTINNTLKSYTFTGTGGVQGAPLTKEGIGSLTFNNTGDNSFGGPVTIQDGAVTFSNNGVNTFANGLAVNGGSVTLAGNNTNIITGGSLSIGAGASLTASNANANDFGSSLIDLDGTLIINQSADSTLNGTLSGGGTLIKAGGGTLTLAGDNSALTSVIQINGGAIKAGAPSALGVTGAAITNGGTLNINGQSLAALPVAVSGAGAGGSGAIVNTAAPQLGALANVTLAGNTTFGGSGPWNTDPVLNRGRWDIRNGNLSSGGQTFNLTKVGSNQVTLAGTTVDSTLGDIDVQQGALGFEGATTSMGDAARTLTVRAGATVIFFDTTTAWTKKFVLFGDGATPTLFNWNGANTIAGPVTLNGNVVIGGAPADRGTPISLTLSGPVDGSGGLTKIAADHLVLGGNYTYTGDTTVSAGTLALTDSGAFAGSSNITVNAGATLDVSGAFGGGLTLVSGQTLKGNGAIIGTLTAPAGSIVSPGLGIGELTISGDVALQGTTFIDLDAIRDTNDVLRSDGAISFAGTLQLTNIVGALGAGEAFKIFNARNYTGSFANVLPANPGSGLAWDTSTLAADGTLRIRAGSQRPVIGTTSVAGGAFIFSGTGGTPSATYHVLSSTNLSAAPSAWSRIGTNTFSSTGNFSVTNIVDANTPQRFFLLEAP